MTDSENLLTPGEADFLIQHLNPTKVKNIGTVLWFEEHKRLEKLRCQGFIEATNLREEYIVYLLLHQNKIGVLLHEVLCMNIWKLKMLKKLKKITDKEPKFTFIAYMIFYHECSALNLLQIALHQKNSIEALNDDILDLIDYCVLKVIGLNSVMSEEKANSDENLSSMDQLLSAVEEINFNTQIASITIFFEITNCLDELSLSTIKRLYATHDVPILMAVLLDIKPWKRGCKIYDEGKWKDWDGETLPKFEAHCWLILRALLLHSVKSQCYEITNYRRRQLLKIQKYMNDRLFDQLSPLLELKHIMVQLSMSSVPHQDFKSNTLLMECEPQLRTKLLRDKDWNHTIDRNLKLIFDGEPEEVQKIAKILSDTYDEEILDRFKSIEISKEIPGSPPGKKCAKCGKSATKKCANCQIAFYCNRFCQIQDWPYHKQTCTN